MRRGNHAFTLTELVVVTEILAIVLAMAAASSGRARELSRRMVCNTNLKGIGAAARVYADDNNGRWMIPPFKSALIDNEGVNYLAQADDCPGFWQGQVGFERQDQSTSETLEAPHAGSTSVTTTRAFWMLVRSGDITVKQYVCPSSGDEDLSENVDLYYDFTCYRNISYGYQVPFGPRDTSAREGMDSGQIVAADKGPYYLPSRAGCYNPGAGPNLRLDDPPKAWRPFNSFNHGGAGNGEGQNCLYADGHSSFQRIPAVGVDNDNIYTLMVNDWHKSCPPIRFNLICGVSPHDSAEPNPYPGQNAFGDGPGLYSSTDTMVYP